MWRIPFWNISYGSRQAKMCLRACAKCTDSISCHACVKSHPGICYSFLRYIDSNDSVSGQWRSWSDCADAQADLGLPCPHMPEDAFYLREHPNQLVCFMNKRCKVLCFAWIFHSWKYNKMCFQSEWLIWQTSLRKQRRCHRRRRMIRRLLSDGFVAFLY